jgi:HTH-type transcriptional regulator/antitoxin HigA
MTSALVSKRIFGSYKDIPTTYEALNALYPLRIIKNDDEYERAVSIASSIVGHNLSEVQDDYLSTLEVLILSYQDEHIPFNMPVISGIDALRGLMADHDMSASDLARLLGTHRSLASKILLGQRSLTTGHLKILCEHFKVSADLFLVLHHT